MNNTAPRLDVKTRDRNHIPPHIICFHFKCGTAQVYFLQSPKRRELHTRDFEAMLCLPFAISRNMAKAVSVL